VSSALPAIVVFGCLLGAVWLGIALRRILPENHLTTESQDAVKLAMGLVGTMAALILGLLVSSAKDTYDTKRTEVIQMAAKIAFLNRVLAAYGPEAAETRARFREAVEQGVRRMWPEHAASEVHQGPDIQSGNRLYADIQRLSPHGDAQADLKTQATAAAMQLGELQSLLVAQSVASVSKPLLIILVFWLVVILLSFSLFAPPNATVISALIVSALALSAAIFLILELAQPFGGLIRISSEPMLNALTQLEK
jgi:Protein of unknown function (DUF4239)